MPAYVQVALEKTAILERQVESFFAYTKAEFLDQPVQLQMVSLGDLLADAVETMAPQAAARRVLIVTRGDAGDCAVQADPHMLTRVAQNLLENALRYTPEGGTVQVGWRGDAERCQFWVRDTGPGIPPEDLGRVFQPLSRVDTARGSRTGGAGLGLAIAIRLVRAHGGTISAANQNGAVFTVTLPQNSSP